METTENSKKKVKPNPQPIPQFHFKDDSDDTNKSEKEEIKALEINSTSNDQKDSRQEIDNWNLDKTDSLEKRLSDVKIKKDKNITGFKTIFKGILLKKT